MRFAKLALAVLLFASAASAQDLAKGVNPADNLTRADVAVDYVEVGGDGTSNDRVFALTAGYEHRLAPSWGIGGWFTPLAYYNDNGGDDDDFGTGDFGGRVRYIEHEGDWHLGASLAAAGSTGDLSALGKNRLRVAPSFLVVRPWSEQDYTAAELEWVEFVARGRDFAVFALEQGHLFDGGWFVVGEAAYATKYLNGDSEYLVGVELGKQIDDRWQVAIEPGFALEASDLLVELRAAFFF